MRFLALTLKRSPENRAGQTPCGSESLDEAATSRLAVHACSKGPLRYVDAGLAGMP